MVAHLQKLSGDSSLTLTSIEVGSVKLILDGSDEGFARIESLVQCRQLNELRGFPIEDVYYIAKNIQAKQSKTFGGGDSGSAFYARDAEAAYHEPRLFDLPASSSQSIGNISITGNSNASNILQGDSNTVSQNINHSTATSSDLQAVIAALAQLKEAIANTDALGSYEKKRTKGDVDFIEEEVQKQRPDKSGIAQAIAALKQSLSGVVTLAEPVTKVAELIAKAWMV
ncbi:hypothetical protein [Leptolyngbya sp. FACHB-321]|uniref:hypothetical protein n=1 Tax=Leptolyngbya sp. FACHB-321 TaxID=2692807 RepID=UPI00321FE30B